METAVGGRERDFCTLASWLRCRYRIIGAPGDSAAGSTIPRAWLKRLHGFLQRVDWGDPTLWVSRANTPCDRGAVRTAPHAPRTSEETNPAEKVTRAPPRPGPVVGRLAPPG